MARLEIVKDIASQRIYFYPQEGRPSATPSVSIKDEAGTTITAASTTNVTQSTVNTTVSSASSINDTSLTLTAVTGIEVRQVYLVTNSVGQKEWVRVNSVNSSSKVVTLDEPLRYAHDTAATFVGTSFYRTLSTAEVATLNELYRARATYTVSSINYVVEIPFDVVLTPLNNPLTVEFIKVRRPDIMAYEPSETRGTDFLDFRTQAWERVKKGIRQAGWRPALLRTPEDVEDWAIAEFDLLCQRNGIKILRDWGDAEQAIRYLEEQITQAKNHSLSSLSFYDAQEDDSRSTDDERPLRMAFIR